MPFGSFSKLFGHNSVNQSVEQSILIDLVDSARAFTVDRPHRRYGTGEGPGSVQRTQKNVYQLKIGIGRKNC